MLSVLIGWLQMEQDERGRMGANGRRRPVSEMERISADERIAEVRAGFILGFSFIWG